MPLLLFSAEQNNPGECCCSAHSFRNSRNGSVCMTDPPGSKSCPPGNDQPAKPQNTSLPLLAGWGTGASKTESLKIGQSKILSPSGNLALLLETMLPHYIFPAVQQVHQENQVRQEKGFH